MFCEVVHPLEKLLHLPRYLKDLDQSIKSKATAGYGMGLFVCPYRRFHLPLAFILKKYKGKGRTERNAVQFGSGQVCVHACQLKS